MFLVCVFYIVKAPRPGAFSYLIVQQFKYGNRNALSMFKALNKGFKYKMRSYTFKQS